jgi:hypothetical protein
MAYSAKTLMVMFRDLENSSWVGYEHIRLYNRNNNSSSVKEGFIVIKIFNVLITFK